jgi:hypothetical protein
MGDIKIVKVLILHYFCIIDKPTIYATMWIKHLYYNYFCKFWELQVLGLGMNIGHVSINKAPTISGLMILWIVWWYI